MELMEHLEELRDRLIRILIVVGIIFLICFSFGIGWFNYGEYSIPYIYPSMSDTISTSIFSKVSSDLVPDGVRTIVTTPMDAIVVQLEVSFFLGILFGMPMIIYQLGRFASPGLYPHERRFIVKLSVPATILFAIGCIFSYVMVIPFIMHFLYGYAFAMGAQTFVNVNAFISFVLLFMAAFGLVFELPIVMSGLTYLDVVSAEFWKENWRYAVVIMVIFGAAVTPDGSGITQLIVAGPMILLYYAGFLASSVITRSNEKRSRQLQG